MTWNLNISSDTKQKVRKLKKAEITIRFSGKPSNKPLVWDSFFNPEVVKELDTMSPQDYRALVDDFFSRVYYEFYMESGIIFLGAYDPAVLARLDLPPHTDEAGVKARFRELAKKHHPDSGGDAAQFIELMKTYRELIGR